jgi:hypothetical protein
VKAILRLGTMYCLRFEGPRESQARKQHEAHKKQSLRYASLFGLIYALKMETIF